MKRHETLLATDGEKTTIVIAETVDRAQTLEEQDKWFTNAATDLELALFHSLPGGLYDRLLGAMLARKSSHFIVRHR